MNRPSFESIYMRLAVLLSERSTCQRLKVGTVITSSDFRRVLSIGYNGNAQGFPNQCDQDTPGGCGCLHSEENAIINCSADRGTPKKIFITHLPCVMCAKRLINLGGVVAIYYGQDYRDQRSIDLLKEAEIPITQFNLE